MIGSLTELWRRLWYFIRRDSMAAELAEEMRLHVELRERREREAGRAPAEAAAQVRRRFGNPARLLDLSRDQWRVRWLDELAMDLAFGVRMLRRAPLPSTIVVLTLAVAIGAALAMFTVMDAALFRPLPVHEPEQLVVIRGGHVPTVGSREQDSPHGLAAVRQRRDVYEDVGAYAAGGLNLVGGREPQRVQAGLLTPSALRLLGVQPLYGRLFVEDEEQPGGADVVVLSHKLWQSQFGSDHEIIGRHVQLNDRSYEIVGVMPPRFHFPEGSELWIPMTVPLTKERTEIFRFLIVTNFVARLSPGVTPAFADARYIETLIAAGNAPRDDRPLPEIHSPLRGYFMGDSRERLLLVMALATLVLGAACANCCGLLLARWSSRRREIGVRAAIGASRRRVLRQLLTEGAVLVACGALLALWVAHAALSLFGRLVPHDLAALAPAQIDGRSLLALLFLGMIAAFALGMLPAISALRGDVTRALTSAGSSRLQRPGGWRLGSVLVVAQVGVTVMLLIGSGLILKSLVRLHAVETGMDPDQVVTARIALSFERHAQHADRAQFYSQLQRELQQDPALQRTALVNALPLRGEWNPRVAFDLLDRPDSKESPFAELVRVTPDYFSALRIRVVAGRAMTSEDTVSGGGAMVTESLARSWWPGSTPLGARISTGGRTDERVIVGVVRDVRTTSLDGEIQPQLYIPFVQAPQATIVARSALPPALAFARLRDAVHRVDPSQVVYDLKTMEQVTRDAIVEQRTTGLLASSFGAVTLFLAALGVYGLLAFGVSQRRRELGIRIALGAQRSRVVSDVIASGARLTALGAGFGIAAAYVLTRLLSARLEEIAIADPAVYGQAAGVLVTVAVLASLIPATRAGKVDPARVLAGD